MQNLRDGCKPDEIRMGQYCIPAFCKTYIDHYGHTTSLPDTGWLLVDGSVMDMSKLYHTDIANGDLARESGVSMDWKQPFQIMHKFMTGCKSIRYRTSNPERWQEGNLLYVQMVNKPTSEQSGKMAKLMQQDVGHVIMERMDEKTAETACFIELFHPHPFDYWKFIERCFK
jgi:hypothetical protein